MDSERAEMRGLGDLVWENDPNSRKDPAFSRYDAVERFLRTGTFSKELMQDMKHHIRRASKRFSLEGNISRIQLHLQHHITYFPVSYS